MQTILTHSKKIKKELYQITARTASGKIASAQYFSNAFTAHLDTAKRLSNRMGWGESLISGETKEGFAFIPAATKNGSWEDVEKATTQLMKAATSFPNGEKDPIRLAMGIIDLAKQANGQK